jgi:hypothetical protein
MFSINDVPRWDITIPAGASFHDFVQWVQPDGVTPVTMAGYTAQMDFRRRYNDPVPLVTLTNGNGLTIHEDTGTVDIDLTHQQSSILGMDRECVVLTALEVTSPEGFRTRLFDGMWTVTPEATRDIPEGG